MMHLREGNGIKQLLQDLNSLNDSIAFSNPIFSRESADIFSVSMSNAGCYFMLAMRNCDLN